MTMVRWREDCTNGPVATVQKDIPVMMFPMSCKGPSDYEQLTFRDVQILGRIISTWQDEHPYCSKFLMDEVIELDKKLGIMYQELMPK